MDSFKPSGNGYISGSGEKWQKFGDQGSSPMKIVTGASKVDSYKPRGSPFVRTSDRAAPQRTDSHRPDPSTRALTAPRWEAPKRRTNLTTQDQLTRPTTSRDIVLSRSGNLPATSGYVSQEKKMEEKARKLGVRREFFQYLQELRVSFDAPILE